MKHHCQAGQYFPSPRTGVQDVSTAGEAESIFLRQLRGSCQKAEAEIPTITCEGKHKTSKDQKT